MGIARRLGVGLFGAGTFAWAVAAQEPPPEPPSDPATTYAVDLCRAAAWQEAAKLGATGVEAVAAGAAKRDRRGRTIVPVHIRITYVRFLSAEVKVGVMNCTIDKEGRVVEATMS